MSEDTAKKLESLVQPFACQKKKPMFGYDVYWINGNMSTGVFQSSIFFSAVFSRPGRVPRDV